MRRVFLWAARNRWLKERLPRLRFMRRAVRRFMPGETIDDALDRRRAPPGGRDRDALHAARREPREPGRGRRGRRRTTAMRRRSHQGGRDRRRDLGQADPARARPRRRTRAWPTSSDWPRYAAADGSYLWIDMEGSAYIDATIELYERLRATQPRTGICLQAYLRRTAADIERLLPLDPAIRLVKGAYDEPEAIAYRDKRSVDSNYVGARRPVPARRSGPADPPGARDPRRRRSSSRSRRASAPAGVGRDGLRGRRCCTGSATTSSSAWRRRAIGSQALIAYGEHWYPWYMRRLAERPANVTFAIRSMLP